MSDLDDVRYTAYERLMLILVITAMWDGRQVRAMRQEPWKPFPWRIGCVLMKREKTPKDGKGPMPHLVSSDQRVLISSRIPGLEDARFLRSILSPGRW